MVRPEDSSEDRRPTDAAPSDGAVRAQLGQILASADFAQSGRINAFLSFVVEETLAGRSDRLKEYTIATTVFERDESFDPQTNTIVRVEAGRLRRRLERYYLTEGREDPVRIDLPKGTYVPLFRTARPADPAPPKARQEGDAPRDVALEHPKGPSIAVLPFENLSGDPGQEFFADGITEEIINALTRFPDLRVIARHSTFKYKGQPIDVRDVGRDLGVGYVLEGSVRKAGDMIRVTGQLVDAADGMHLFSETYDRDLSAQSIFEVQDDISDGIVAAVGQPYGIIARADARLAKGKAPQHLDAYDAVLRFYEYWVHPSLELHRSVQAALQRGVELDPGYASAWAALAETYLDELIFGYNPRHEGDALDRALDAAQRAVMLDPENSMAYHVLSNTHFHRGDLDEFKAAGTRAIALNPNHADMLSDFGIRLCCIGEWDRGRELTDKAIALSPTHPGWFHAAAVLDHYRRGEYEAALVEAKQFRSPGLVWHFVFLAMCYGQLGHDQEAGAACDELSAMVPDFAEHAWAHLAAWNFQDDYLQRVVDGLRKAGLAVPDSAS